MGAPEYLYVFAVFSAIGGVAASIGYQPAEDALYPWTMAAGWALAGFILVVNFGTARYEKRSSLQSCNTPL